MHKLKKVNASQCTKNSALQSCFKNFV